MDRPAETIVSSAGDLVEMSERAREVEELMSVAPAFDEQIPLAEVVSLVADDVRRGFPEASLSVDIDESPTLAIDRTILSRILENLVENALVHNDAPTPVVTVSARQTGDGDAIRLSVADNGPGIPEQERAVITTGVESPLEHGSGLGLWAVKRGVVRLGGEATVSENQPEGSVVTLRLPDVTAERSAPPIAAGQE